MKYFQSILIALLVIAGCEEHSNPVATALEPTSIISAAQDSILFTLTVSKDTLGVQDTLSATITALNQASGPETLYVAENPHFYNWTLTSDSGKVIMQGPTLGNGLVIILPINPHQTVTLYGMAVTFFGASVQPGPYLLQWNLLAPTFSRSSIVQPELSMQIKLYANKNGQVNDASNYSSSIYPLKIGNTWTFRKGNPLPNGSLLIGDTVTETIATAFLIDGETWFLLRSTGFVDQLITARQDGIYLYYSDIKTAVLRYKYPANIGDKYGSGYEEWTGSGDTLVTFQMSADSTNELITVPSGQYRCYKYHAPEVLATFGIETTQIGSEDVYLSGIGPVKKNFGYAIWDLISTNF